MTVGAAVADPGRRRWLALTVVLLAGFMDMLDVTIVNVTIPSMQRDLQAEYAQIEWIVAGYVLGFAAVLVTGGRLGDIFGRKRLFLVGITGFTVASALCGLAVGPQMLIWSRFLQGSMAGLMVPQILAIIHVTFPAEERGKVFGVWGAVVGSASVAGLVAGALLVQWDLFGLEWRPIFLVNVPVGLATLAVAWYVVPESRAPRAGRLDLPGAALSTAGVLMLVYPLTEGRSRGWPLWIFLLMAGAVLVLAAFVTYEWWRGRTVGSPLMDVTLFRTRTFTAGMALWFLFWVSCGGFFLVWTLYMQAGLGWTPLRAGLTSAWFSVGAAASACLAVQVLTPRFGRAVLQAGALLTAGGFAYYGWVADHYGPDVHSWQMVAPLLLLGFGFGTVVAPMVDAILTRVPVRAAGSASGLLNTVQQVGMALGVALVGVVFFTQLDTGSGRGVDRVTPALRGQLAAIGVPAAQRDGLTAGLRACVRERSAATDPTEVPDICRPQADHSPSAERIQQALTRAGEQANAHNFARTFSRTIWYAAGVLMVVLAGMFALPRRVRTRDLSTEVEAADLPDDARAGLGV